MRGGNNLKRGWERRKFCKPLRLLIYETFLTFLVSFENMEILEINGYVSKLEIKML